MSFSAKAVVLSPSSVKITYGSGPAATRALALAELNAIITVVRGEVLSGTVSEGLALGDITDAAGAGEFEDATLVLTKAGPLAGQTLSRNRTIQNVLLSYKLADTNRIDVDNGDIAAIATAFRDGQGAGGYALDPTNSVYEK